jgi:IclR family transcriptional regulator, acetate operon repressor
LVSRRVLERTDGGYRVGLPLRMLGSGSSSQPPPLLERGLAVITDLADATRTNVRMGVLQGLRLAVVEARPGRPAPWGFTEEADPPYHSALGRALLAFSPPAVVEDVLDQARSGEHASSTGVDQVRRILATTRLARLAVHHDEHGMAYTVAVPVFGSGGTVLTALEAGVAGVGTGFEPVRSTLLVAAGSLSRELATTPLSGSLGEAEPRVDPGTEPDSATG